MIKLNELMELFERMEQEHWAYEWGAAQEGKVDCSGAFVWAYRQLSGPDIAHGSNSILRQSMALLQPMSAARPGWAAVKIRAWTDAQKNNRWYGQEPGDGYHIGLVGWDGRILNAKGTATGFVASDPGEGWDGCAPLTDVTYDEGEEEDATMLYRAAVTTEKDPLRVRQSPGTGRIIGHVPRGAGVEVLADKGDGWPRIRYNELVGYASGDYLTRVEDTDRIEIAPDVEAELIDATTLVNEDGMSLTLVGRWSVAQD